MNEKNILVSGCLCGIKCKYNGEDNYREAIARLYDNGDVLPICPEHLGGMPIPRVPCEIEQGFYGEDVLDSRARVFNKIGEDVTKYFIKGAEQTVKFAKSVNAVKVILKQGSPTCGFGRIYDGTFSGKTKSGNGVATAALIRAGIDVEEME